MKIKILKIDSGKYCLHPSCKKDPRYVTPKGRIRKGSIAVELSLKTKSVTYRFYYCRTCIDQILFDCRVNLDSKLWVFQ